MVLLAWLLGRAMACLLAQQCWGVSGQELVRCGTGAIEYLNQAGCFGLYAAACEKAYTECLRRHGTVDTR